MRQKRPSASLIRVWAVTTALPLVTAGFCAAGAARLGDESAEAWFRAAPPLAPTLTLHHPSGASEPVARCGTPEGTVEQRAAVEGARALWRQLFPEEAMRARTIPVAFHVVHHGGEGEVTDEQIAEQIEVLNHGFRQADQTFVLASTDRTRKRKWFRKCTLVNADGEIRRAYTRMTEKLAVDPAHTLNIYSCRPKIGSNTLLGIATFPWYFPEDDPLHSVVVHWDTLPGGSMLFYNEGDTATHEVGHYVGLYHTFTPWEFFGSGCIAPGDEVNDTKYEDSPAFGCPEGRDTCPQAGLDPIHNYMDYSDDACINKFTSGQRRRFNDMLDLFRPSLSP